MICYINKEKFEFLFDYYFNIGKLGYDSDNHEQLMYIDENWQFELDKFIQEKADKAAYILVSDDFPLENNYKPIRKFKFLIHRETDLLRQDRIVPFQERFKKFYCGVDLSTEDIGTKYHEIVNNIIENH